MKSGKKNLSSFELALSEGVKDFAEEMTGKRNKNEQGDKSMLHTDQIRSEIKNGNRKRAIAGTLLSFCFYFQ